MSKHQDDCPDIDTQEDRKLATLEAEILEEDSGQGEIKEKLLDEAEAEELEKCDPCQGARIEIAKDQGNYYWLLYATNGRQLATNVVPYKRLNDLKEAIKSVRETIDDAQIVRLY